MVRLGEVSFRGKVVHGKEKGRLFGFPTINLEVVQKNAVLPRGVYATKVELEGKSLMGVTNIGIRPTADDSDTETVETFLLDYTGDVYDREITLTFFCYIRQTIKFADMYALKTQIDLDAMYARGIFANGNASAYISTSTEETKKIALHLAMELEKGSIISLEGDLGAGKSEFARGLARGLGITCTMPSPTFTILNAYEEQEPCLYHYDWYRIEDVDELYEMGVEDYLLSDGISIIEWAERAREILPQKHLQIDIRTIDETTRCITFLPKGGFLLTC